MENASQKTVFVSKMFKVKNLMFFFFGNRRESSKKWTSCSNWPEHTPKNVLSCTILRQESAATGHNNTTTTLEGEANIIQNIGFWTIDFSFHLQQCFYGLPFLSKRPIPQIYHPEFHHWGMQFRDYPPPRQGGTGTDPVFRSARIQAGKWQA